MKFHRIHLNHEPALREEIRQLKLQLLESQALARRKQDEIMRLSNQIQSERMRRLTANETKTESGENGDS